MGEDIVEFEIVNTDLHMERFNGNSKIIQNEVGNCRDKENSESI